MRRFFLRLCAVISLIGIALAAAIHIDVWRGMSPLVQPILVGASLLVFPVWGAALWVGTQVSRDLGIRWRFFPRIEDIWHLVRKSIEGSPKWVLAISACALAAAFLLPGEGSASLLGEFTARDARIGANVCLIFFSLSAPVLFSQPAARLAQRPAA
jgi:hypothetical protein